MSVTDGEPSTGGTAHAAAGTSTSTGTGTIAGGGEARKDLQAMMIRANRPRPSTDPQDDVVDLVGDDSDEEEHQNTGNEEEIRPAKRVKRDRGVSAEAPPAPPPQQHDEGRDFDLAMEMQEQWEEEWKRQQEMQKKTRSQEEQKGMLQTRTGRATLLVAKLIEVFNQTLRQPNNTTTTTNNRIYQETATLGNVSLVAYDDMVFLAEKMLECQSEYGSFQKPQHISMAYHFTNQQHLQSIRQDGLMSHPEREEKKIKSKSRAHFGDGIYVANNPFFFSHFGDTGLLVAILKGEELQVESRTDIPSPAVMDNDGVNTIIGNKHWKGNAIADETCLRESRQVLPILQFSSDLVDFENSRSLVKDGTALLWRFHLEMQKVLDEFMNDHKPTQPHPIAVNDEEEKRIIRFHKQAAATQQDMPYVKEAMKFAMKEFSSRERRSMPKEQLKHIRNLVMHPRVEIPRIVLDAAIVNGISRHTFTLAILNGRHKYTELLQQANQNPTTTTVAAARPDATTPATNKNLRLALSTALQAFSQSERESMMTPDLRQEISGSLENPKAKIAPSVLEAAESRGISRARFLGAIEEGRQKLTELQANTVSNVDALKKAMSMAAEILYDAGRRGQIHLSREKFNKTCTDIWESLKNPNAAISSGVFIAAASRGIPRDVLLQAITAGRQKLAELQPANPDSTLPPAAATTATRTVAERMRVVLQGSANTRASTMPTGSSSRSLVSGRVASAPPAEAPQGNCEEVVKLEAPACLALDEASYRICKMLQKPGDCTICNENLQCQGRIVQLKVCCHMFHQKCLVRSSLHGNQCPSCGVYANDEPQGKCPSGTMTIRKCEHIVCAGENNSDGSLVLTYKFPSGIQKVYHDRPGKPYGDAERIAYLPNNRAGKKLLSRLKYAWSRGLLFSIETSRNQDKIVWSSVPQKSSLRGGRFGFPDPNFFTSANAKLDELRVPASAKIKT